MKNSLVLLAVIIALLATWTLAGIVSNTIAELEPQQLAYTMKSDGMIIFMLIFGWIPALCIGVDVHSSFKNDSITKLESLSNSAAELEFVSDPEFEEELEQFLTLELKQFLAEQTEKRISARAEKNKTQNTTRSVS